MVWGAFHLGGEKVAGYEASNLLEGDRGFPLEACRNDDRTEFGFAVSDKAGNYALNI